MDDNTTDDDAAGLLSGTVLAATGEPLGPLSPYNPPDEAPADQDVVYDEAEDLEPNTALTDPAVEQRNPS